MALPGCFSRSGHERKSFSPTGGRGKTPQQGNPFCLSRPLIPMHRTNKSICWFWGREGGQADCQKGPVLSPFLWKEPRRSEHSVAMEIGGKDGHALTWTDLRAGQKRTASVRVLHFLNPVCPLTLSLGQHSLGVRDSFKSESRSRCREETSLHLQSVDHTHPASRWEDENSICKRHGKSTLARERH